MKNILIINQYASNPRSGFGGRSYYLAQSLAKFNNVTLIYGSFNHLLRSTINQNSYEDKNNGNSFQVKALKVFSYKGSRSLFRIINWFIFLFKLCFLSKKNIGFKPDYIIYSSPALPGYIGAYILAKKLSCPLFLEVRDIWPLSILELGSFSKRNLLIVILHQIEKFAYESSDGIISNLNNLQEHIAKHTNKKIRFHFSPNGVVQDINLLNQDLNKSRSSNHILEELNIIHNLGKTIVGYVGGLAAANAMDLFVDSALLATEDSNLFFAIVGEGPERKRLEKKCISLNLNNIKFYSGVTRSDVASILSAMDILFLANQFKEIYSFGVSPMKLPEYLESKKPIIHATNSMSLLDTFECWEVVKEYNPSAILKSVYSIKNLHKNEKQAMGDRARKMVIENLNYDSIGRSLMLFLEDFGK